MADRESIQRVYTIGHFMPRRGIDSQWNDQRITDYPTAPQRHNRIISVYYGHSHLGLFTSTRAMFYSVSAYCFLQSQAYLRSNSVGNG